MADVKAPFNFVPLSNKVFYPDWADCVSQDIPFEDSVSGTITLKISAKSPIFVRNGHVQKNDIDNDDEYKSFSNDEGKYFIPSTSIKGAVRNVLETMSFGKMKTQETHKYAHREWDDTGLGLYDIKTKILKLRCGWLKKTPDGVYRINDCGRPWRIGFDALDSYLGKPLFENNFSDDKVKNADLNSLQKDALKNEQYEKDPKSSFYKYQFFDSLSKPYKQLRFSHIKKPVVGKDGKMKDNRRLKVDPNGEIVGTIVMTGQSSTTKFTNRKIGSGKFYEFVFVEESKKTYDISEEYYKDLAYIYRKNPEWAYHESKISSVGIPVFFRVERDKLIDFGLAFMYKQPFEKAPSDWIPVNHKNESLDMAECMFGYISKDGVQNSLRGRVQFGHAFCTRKVGTQLKEDFVLANPRASFYPLYAKD
uniref:TIGR03986 family type III CRISPR-associated RAMP protein n=1 Tax=uncultured Fibrobacter sp. TaxID=261512 RepID=UPI0025994774